MYILVATIISLTTYSLFLVGSWFFDVTTNSKKDEEERIECYEKLGVALLKLEELQKEFYAETRYHNPVIEGAQKHLIFYSNRCEISGRRYSVKKLISEIALLHPKD